MMQPRPWTTAILLAAVAVSAANATGQSGNADVADRALREKLLRPVLPQIQRVVFTKHFDMGGSHYAYTEALSDYHKFNAHAAHEFNFHGGSSLCLLEINNLLETTVTTLLADATGVIRDPTVSYDGKRILFSWKKSQLEDDYHLYEMDAATRDVRQLTSGVGQADIEGVYLPSGDIVFGSTRCVQNVDCWHTPVSNLFTMDRDGKYMRRLGFDQVHTNYPQVHPTSGLITYTRWEYNDRGQIFPQALFQMFPNGAQQTTYYGNNSYFPTSILHARGIPGTGKVLAVLSGHHTRQQGKLAIIDNSISRQECAGVTLVAPVVKPTGTIRIDRYGQDGDQWQYPYPLDETNYLVTFRPAGAVHFGIYFMNKAGERVLLAEDPAISCNQPVPLKSMPLPPQPSFPVDWSNKNGAYTIIDIYNGAGLQGIARGTVKRLRVVALDFMATDIGRKNGPSTISDNAAWDVKKVLGETPVYADGSAAFIVPARTPVYFQALDANRRVVATMRSWSTLQPGETFGCVGCHYNKMEAPPVAATTIAIQTGIKPLEPFYDISGKGFSFPNIIQPVLDAKCVSCHNGTTPPDLRGTKVWDTAARKNWNQSYLALLSPGRDAAKANDTNQGLNVIEECSRYLSWIGRWSVPTVLPPYSAGAAKSPLLITYLQPDYKGHERLVMTREDLDKIACWIDLVVPHSGDWTEGMTPADSSMYLKVLAKRSEWEKQEAINIADWLHTPGTTGHPHKGK